MDNSDSGGCYVFILWLITIGISIGTGILAWNFIEPDSFFGALLFLILWAVFSKIGHFIAVAMVALLGGMD